MFAKRVMQIARPNDKGTKYRDTNTNRLTKIGYKQTVVKYKTRCTLCKKRDEQTKEYRVKNNGDRMVEDLFTQSSAANRRTHGQTQNSRMDVAAAKNGLLNFESMQMT